MMTAPARTALLFVLALGLATVGCASGGAADAGPPEDFAVDLSWSSASVPPPYNYSRDIEIDASGAGTVR
ncbi:MAG: hypothetical protein AAFQ43_02175, partial [Bacteroidota bacterium]